MTLASLSASRQAATATPPALHAQIPANRRLTLAELSAARKAEAEARSRASRLSSEAAELARRGHLKEAATRRKRAAAEIDDLPSSQHRGLDTATVVPQGGYGATPGVSSRPLPSSVSAPSSSFLPSGEFLEALRDVPSDVLARISTLPFQLQREEASKARAARLLIPLLSPPQFARILGMESEEFEGRPRGANEGQFVATILSKWSAGYIRSLASSWIHFVRWTISADRHPIRGKYSGSTVAAYLDAVDATARLAHANRSRGAPPVQGAAAGATARGSRANKLRALWRDLHFPLDTGSLVVQVAGKRQKRVGVRKRTLTERGLLKLERLASMESLSPCVRFRAAGFVAAALNALRHISAQRFQLTSITPELTVRDACKDETLDPSFRSYLQASGGVVRGVVLSDPKSGSVDGLTAVTSARGISGSTAWAHMLLSLQRRCQTKCVVYDDDSPKGDPFQAHVSFDCAAVIGRSEFALRCLLASDVCGPTFSRADLSDAVPHMLKSFLSTISTSSGDRPLETNEIGKWSGSAAQTACDPHSGPSPAAARAAAADESRRFSILAAYTHEALGDGGRVCLIMERQIARARARLLSTHEEDLPARGGFGYYDQCDLR